MAIKIETERLILIPVSEKYETDIFGEFTPEVTRYMPFTPNGNIEETKVFIANSKLGLDNGTDIVLAILNREDMGFMGCCGLHNISKESVEIGLWLRIESHGFGYGTEVVSALIEYIKNNISCDSVIYPVDKDNIASKRLPEKFGFSVFKEYVKKKSEDADLNIIEYRKMVKE